MSTIILLSTVAAAAFMIIGLVLRTIVKKLHVLQHQLTTHINDEEAEQLRLKTQVEYIVKSADKLESKLDDIICRL